MNTATDTGTYTRVLAAVVGLWILMRSITSDSTGRTLIDHLMGRKASKSPLLSQPISSGAKSLTGAVQGAASDVKSGSIDIEVAAIARQHGWNASEISAWLNVIHSESNGTLTDTNPSSGAYGLAQFIKGPSEYYTYGGNPHTVAGQLTAMANYIKSRYGTPSAAWSFHQANNWY